MRRLKLFLAALGFTLAAAGVALDQRPLVWGAMVGLGGALAIRLWERRNHGTRAGSHGPTNGGTPPTA
jgi:hypothetical protein